MTDQHRILKDKIIEAILALVLIVAISFFGEKSVVQAIESEGKRSEVQKQKEIQLENIYNIEETPSEADLFAGEYPIMGDSDITARQMVELFWSAGVPYPKEELAKGGADSIEAFCNLYCEEARAEGVRPEVAFAQTMKETGWLQFGGDASIEQFNFAGLGTTGNQVPGNTYPDVRTGIRAQIQHLKAYATTEALSNVCVDERYGYVIKGSAPYVEWLGKQENPEGQGWATAKDYGNSIVDLIRKMKNGRVE